jgi:hypothetical protein
MCLATIRQTGTSPILSLISGHWKYGEFHAPPIFVVVRKIGLMVNTQQKMNISDSGYTLRSSDEKIKPM